MLGAGIFGGGGAPWELDAPYLGNPKLGGPWRDLSPVFSAQVSVPLRLPDKTAWTGTLVSKEGEVTGQFAFVLEQLGTIGGDVPLHEYPNPTAWIERVEGRDSYEASA